MSSRLFAQILSAIFALTISLSLLSVDKLNRSVAYAQYLAPAASPTPTGQPSPTISPTAGTPSPTPGLPQPTRTSSGAASGSQPTSSDLSLRLLFILALGGLGILLATVLAVRRRLQEMQRLAAEARRQQDGHPPE